MIPVQMPTPPIPSEVEQEEARRQAAGQGSSGLDGIGDGIRAVSDAASDGTLGAIADAASAAVEGVATVAQVSLEVVGSILGGLGDL